VGTAWRWTSPLTAPQETTCADTADVLFHTALTQPGRQRQRFLLRAPSHTGDYDYICSFPGHATLMRGVMHVVAK
jgi:azurin